MPLDELQNQLENAQNQLTTLGLAFLQFLVIVGIATIIARWLRRRLRQRFSTTASPATAVVVENSAAVGVYVIAITIVLALWGMTWSGLITALSIGTVAVAFGFQDFLRSIVGGILILIEQPFLTGDRIRVRDVEGDVEKIDLRTTIIRSTNGDRIAVPNALMFSDPIVNRSPNRIRRVISVSHIEGPPAELKKRALEALTGLPDIDSTPTILVRTRKVSYGMRDAIDALPGVDLEPKKMSAITGIGLKIVTSGDRNPAALDEAKRRLQAAFPDARITS
jgi:small-conductance mechanosensitive channel